MEESLRALRILIEKLNTLVKKINPSDDLYKIEDYIETIKNVIMDIEDKIEDLDYEFEKVEFPNQRQLYFKFCDYKSDFENIKVFYKKKKAEVMAEIDKKFL